MMTERVLLSFAAFFAMVLGGYPAAGQAGESYKVDPVHSTLLFKVKHFGAGNFIGRFNDVSGSFVLDEKDPAKSTVEIQVKADSIDTANEKRNQHLKGPDFFNVKQFSSISFKGKSVKKGGDHAYEVTGDLTLHGVTKEVKIQVEHVGSGKDPQGTQRAGFEATFKLKRSDFGMNFMVGPLGDEVQIIASLECTS